eukprot:1551567-Rhodomonas_salina.1
MSKRGVLHASVALVALSAVLCFVAVSLMGSSSNTETVLAFKHPNKRAEWAKCAKIAKIFKGTKPDHRQITESEKREAKQCVHLIKMAKAIKAKDMKLNQAEQSCTCCSFPGCPCCQVAFLCLMSAGLHDVAAAMTPAFALVKTQSKRSFLATFSTTFNTLILFCWSLSRSLPSLSTCS